MNRYTVKNLERDLTRLNDEFGTDFEIDLAYGAPRVVWRFTSARGCEEATKRGTPRECLAGVNQLIVNCIIRYDIYVDDWR